MNKIKMHKPLLLSFTRARGRSVMLETFMLASVLCGCGQPVQDVLTTSWTPGPKPAPEIPAYAVSSGLERLSSRELQADEPMLELHEKRYRVLIGQRGEFVAEVVTGFGHRGQLTTSQLAAISSAVSKAGIGTLPVDLYTSSDVYRSLKTFGSAGRSIRVLPRGDRDSKELERFDLVRREVLHSVPEPDAQISQPIQAKWSNQDPSGTAQAVVDIRLRKNSEFQRLTRLVLPAPGTEKLEPERLLSYSPAATDRMLVNNGTAPLGAGESDPTAWIRDTTNGLTVGKEMSVRRGVLAGRGQFWLNQTGHNLGCALVVFDGDAEPSAARFFNSLDEHGIALVGGNRVRYGWDATNGQATGPNLCTSFFYTSPRPGFFVMAYDLESLAEVLTRVSEELKGCPPKIEPLLPLVERDAAFWGLHEIQDGEREHPFPMPAELKRVAVSYKPGSPPIWRSPDMKGEITETQRLPPGLDLLIPSGFFVFI